VEDELVAAALKEGEELSLLQAAQLAREAAGRATSPDKSR
jgi:hypothetical protein